MRRSYDASETRCPRCVQSIPELVFEKAGGDDVAGPEVTGRAAVL
jgi:hypothetical protein